FQRRSRSPSKSQSFQPQRSRSPSRSQPFQPRDSHLPFISQPFQSRYSRFPSRSQPFQSQSFHSLSRPQPFLSRFQPHSRKKIVFESEYELLKIANKMPQYDGLKGSDDEKPEVLTQQLRLLFN
ncbi:4068_t:CDS:2, partial [Racocetra fulgida]